MPDDRRVGLVGPARTRRRRCRSAAPHGSRRAPRRTRRDPRRARRVLDHDRRPRGRRRRERAAARSPAPSQNCGSQAVMKTSPPPAGARTKNSTTRCCERKCDSCGLPHGHAQERPPSRPPVATVDDGHRRDARRRPRTGRSAASNRTTVGGDLRLRRSGEQRRQHDRERDRSSSTTARFAENSFALTSSDRPAVTHRRLRGRTGEHGHATLADVGPRAVAAVLGRPRRTGRGADPRGADDPEQALARSSPSDRAPCCGRGP